MCTLAPSAGRWWGALKRSVHAPFLVVKAWVDGAITWFGEVDKPSTERPSFSKMPGPEVTIVVEQRLV
jgi:hypothetical protein